MFSKKKPAWVYQGKSINQLLEELSTFEDQKRVVLISIDYGDNLFPINLIEKKDGFYLLCTDSGNATQAKHLALEKTKCGITIEKLVAELQKLEKKEWEARIAIDSEENHKPISLVGKNGIFCMLLSSSDFYDQKIGQV